MLVCSFILTSAWLFSWRMADDDYVGLDYATFTLFQHLKWDIMNRLTSLKKVYCVTRGTRVKWCIMAV